MKQYLIQTILRPFYKKRLLGKDYMLFKDYYSQSYILSQYCVTLGYMYNDKFSIFMELFANQKIDMQNAIEGIEKMGERIKNGITVDTKNGHDLFVETQIKPFIDIFYKDKNIDYNNVYDLFKISNDKIPLNVIEALTEMLIFSSVGFGFKYPELTKNLLTYKVDDKIQDLAYNSGLDIPKEKIEITLEDNIIFSKELIKPYVTAYRADLIETLNLN